MNLAEIDHSMATTSMGFLDDATTSAPPTFEQLRAELESFVSQTRRRLNALSETLARPASTRIAASIDTVLDQPQTHCEIAAPVSQAVIEISHSTCHPPVDSTPEQTEQLIDPLDRLGAIKLRLAEQIENACEHS